MWLFTNIGFYSIVQKPGDSCLAVRAMASQDLDNLREKYMPELGPTVEGAGTDYPYRAQISHEAFGWGLARIGLDIDYSNFKDEVRRQQGAGRVGVYRDVWAALRRGFSLGSRTGYDKIWDILLDRVGYKSVNRG